MKKGGMDLNKRWGLGVLALPLCAAACSELTVVGLSGELETKPVATATVPQPGPRTATEIAAVRGELLLPSGSLGDIDGDGYDDFMLTGQDQEVSSCAAISGTAYLFYGRPRFEAHLSVSQADATFDTGALAIGDVNGDGLGDLAFADCTGYELVLGSKTRLTGHHAKFSTGLVVRTSTSSSGASDALPPIFAMSKLGDLNGDGRDEFTVTIYEGEVTGTLNGAEYADGSPVTYIIEGRESGWPTGTWNPSWGVALGHATGPDGIPTRFSGAGAGDLDGDGFTDLLTMGHNTLRLFYGGPDILNGPLTEDRVDAEILLGSDGQPVWVVGDVDGDGRDDFALSQDNALSITYGTRTRLTGRVRLQPDLQFVEKGPYLSVFVADTNGDGLPDLVFTANAEKRHIETWEPPPPTSLRLYVVLGTGTRRTGELDASAQFAPVGYVAPAALMTGDFDAAPVGDLDGDGSTDLVLDTYDPQNLTQPKVYLLPGSMREPE